MEITIMFTACLHVNFCRTTKNCTLNPNNNNDGSGDGCDEGASTSVAGVVAEVQSEVNLMSTDVIQKDEKPVIRDTPKPPARLTKNVRRLSIFSHKW